jgi:coenzyme F420-reducing hydrogenase delta subunit/DNA-binding CsgD family transcriptional regulator
MCSGRVDLAFLLRALQGGADGVLIGGCWPGECHYVTEGNYDALGSILLGRKLLAQLGVEPERLRLEWIAASEGSRFAEVMSEFTQRIRELGPLGQPEGLDEQALRVRLEAATRLVPYLKLVEREKLRISTKSEEAYTSFYESDEAQRLFESLVAEKLTTSQILTLLGDSPLSTAEIAERLGLSPSQVSRYMNGASRQGLVRYDLAHKCYALA